MLHYTLYLKYNIISLGKNMEKKSETTRFEYKLSLSLLKQINDDKEKVDVRLFHDLCKAFIKMSASMGSLVSWGFDGILAVVYMM